MMVCMGIGEEGSISREAVEVDCLVRRCDSVAGAKVLGFRRRREEYGL